MARNSYKDESNDRQYFTIIPNYIANHSSANDQALYLQMKRIVGDKEGVCYASEKYFKEKLKIGSKALKKSIKYLLEHGWIEDVGIQEIETKGGVQKSHLYIVKDIWEMNIKYYKGVSKREPLTPKGVSESNQRGVQKEAKGVSPEQQIRTYNKNYNNILPTKVGNEQKLKNPRDLRIDIILSYLKSKAEWIDGSQRQQRYGCSIFLKRVAKLIKDLSKQEPTDQQIVDGCKRVIDLAATDKFHSKNMGRLKYLYDNIGTIVKSSQRNNIAII